MVRFYSLSIAAMLAVACGGRQNVQCEEDGNCDLTGGGVCIEASTGNKWCAYPDPECPSGLRFSDQNVGDGVGGTCTAGTQYMLTVNVGGNGAGSVVTEPEGVTCSSGTCTGLFREGAVVDLSALPSSGVFLGWADDCNGRDACTVVMDQDHTVGALFGTPGEALWAKQLGSSGDDIGHGITVDTADDVIAVGEFSGTLTLGSTVLTSSGGQDFYVVKFAGNTGDLIWAKRFGGPSDDFALAVASDAENNIYVTGRVQDTVDFGGGATPPAGSSDAFILQLTSGGSFGWAKRIGGTGYERGESIAVRGDVAAITGNLMGSMTIGTTTISSVGLTDAFVFACDAKNGTPKWLRQFGGSGVDIGEAIAIDAAGNVAVAGEFEGSVDFGGGVMTSAGQSDVFLLKLGAASGNHLVSKRIGSSGIDTATGVATDSNNALFVTGGFTGTVDVGCPSSLVSAQTNIPDVFLVKYTQGGSCVWTKGFGAAASQQDARDVAVNAAGDVVIVGSFCGSVAFGGPTLSSAGPCASNGGDVYAARLSGADGSHLNSVRAGGTGLEQGSDVAQSSDGRFFLTGRSAASPSSVVTRSHPWVAAMRTCSRSRRCDVHDACLIARRRSIIDAERTRSLVVRWLANGWQTRLPV